LCEGQRAAGKRDCCKYIIANNYRLQARTDAASMIANITLLRIMGDGASSAILTCGFIWID
jgi:hypothetical protein